MCYRYIRWPKRHEFADTVSAWYEAKGLPRVLGAIDGTQVAIRWPTRSDNAYCHKGYHSLNVMVSTMHFVKNYIIDK